MIDAEKRSFFTIPNKKSQSDKRVKGIIDYRK